ncbi:MAG: hypothetical protein EJNHJLOP_00039 [Methanophagales virus PBV082]|uniref:Uncharacterized protein n=1 Tax=Methanophagales virus PBV082 TaxID=3071307 RepID=A0AA46TEB9_9VIRU|nr:MAG: hypothetical protein QIT52_gp39 [Methanophagales virus PBV082]UYL64928.1 MAG: hypothetical protein EJNHJLOP_00039 [Methanophagales virus PBV082]
MWRSILLGGDVTWRRKRSKRKEWRRKGDVSVHILVVHTIRICMFSFYGQGGDRRC